MMFWKKEGKVPDDIKDEDLKDIEIKNEPIKLPKTKSAQLSKIIAEIEKLKVKAEILDQNKKVSSEMFSGMNERSRS